MARVINTDDLPGTSSRQFEGYRYGDVDVSVFVSAAPPGRGPSLHTRPCAEVFVVQAGSLTFVVGDPDALGRFVSLSGLPGAQQRFGAS